MTTLDHRILIPRSPELIWETVSDVAKNTSWQVDSKSISLISTKHTGSGVRWRCATAAGKEFVAEISVWYDGLGYEYKLVDGVPYRENTGRIRLQEIAEGTIVQWTFTYELGGVLGGLRNAVSVQRQLDSNMIESLKNLYRLVVNKRREDGTAHEAKSLMRDGVDYEARSQYKPRHPSALAEMAEANPVSAAPIDEPPLTDEDTRPNKPVTVDEKPQELAAPTAEPNRPPTLPDFDSPWRPPAESAPSAAAPGEPDFLVELPPIESVEPTAAIEPAITEPKEKTQESVAVVATSTPEVAPEEPVAEAEQPQVPQSEETPPVEPVVMDTAEAPRYSPTPTTTSTITAETPTARDLASMDTAEISVFEIFGLPKPSETQEMQAVLVDRPFVGATQSAEASIVPASMVVSSTRMGLRLILRRKLVKLRRPE